MSEEDQKASREEQTADAKGKSHDKHSAQATPKNKAAASANKNKAQSNAPQTSGEETENGNRMDAAKAFFRAMYAGDEVGVEKYGMNVETVDKNNTSGSCVNCDQLASEFQQAQTKAAEIEGLYKRMAADFDNYRKRIEREREDLVGIGIQKAIEALLPALDDLDRAQATFNNNSDAASILESIKLISARFTKCLEQLGIKPLETIGQPFDPRLHEPVQQIITNDFPEGSVAHELRRGYALGDKVIRPTLVNVAAGDSQTEESHNNNQFEENEDH